MVKAVLTYKPVSIYDDLPEDRYHFPRSYRRQVEAALGDLIVYYEPGRTGTTDSERTGRRAYVAVARLARIESDPRSRDHYYAYMEPGSYFVLDCPVPFREGGEFYESGLRRADGLTSKGAFGRAVRPLTDPEFEAILCAGFARELGFAHEAKDPPDSTEPGLAEAPVLFQRPLIEQILSRPMRDAAFKRAVRDAYDLTCAVTGLSLRNGGGRPEVEAAHIRPVEQHGPDSIRNGIALSRTFHWLFDRGLISFGGPPSFEVLVTRKGLPDEVMRTIAPSHRLRVPGSPLLHPAPAFLDFHRSSIFERSS